MMLIERAEQLKRDLTDQWVVVKKDVPELRRFEGLTGKVKTVNMNCRVLVQFDNPVDISWYDIDPDYLQVVDAPLPKEEQGKKEEKKAAPKPKATTKNTTGGMSPLEAARAQGAAGEEKPSTPKKSGGMSPLEMARQQGAAGAEKTESEQAASTTESSEKRNLSPLELARQQGAAGTQSDEAQSTKSDAAEETSASEEASAADEKPANNEEETSGLSPLELARKQGAFKG